MNYSTPKDAAVILINQIEAGVPIMRKAHEQAQRIKSYYRFTLPESSALVYHLIQTGELVWRGVDGGEGDWVWTGKERLEWPRFKEIIEQMKAEGYIKPA